MNRMRREANRLRTASTTSTTGPHVRLVQNLGVAKVTTNGTRAASAPAIDERSRSRSGGVRVVRLALLPCVVASVGVREAGAFAPRAGVVECAFTSRIPIAWIFAPVGAATSQ